MTVARVCGDSDANVLRTHRKDDAAELLIYTDTHIYYTAVVC